jgi:hypothetical protein
MTDGDGFVSIVQERIKIIKTTIRKKKHYTNPCLIFVRHINPKMM